jgi:DNA-binding CsgD family transcriptional regulator
MPLPTDKAILDKLDTILKVLALQVASDKSITERARLLKMAGLDNKTIANVLNTTPLTVSVLTANLRIKTKRKNA